MATQIHTYLTTDELSARIKYDVRTIRERMLDSVLLEGVHYIRPFGGRKILYLWEQIEKDMVLASKGAYLSPVTNSSEDDLVIPMAGGRNCRVTSTGAAADCKPINSRVGEVCHG